MSAGIIKLDGFTKDYGKGRGVFDISFEVAKGEVFGYIGTNGSGKTTTIRGIMGFIKPDSGTASVMQMDAWKNAVDIKPYTSYVPGEIAFPPLQSGVDFLKLQAEYLGVTDFTYMNKLLKMFKLDPTANLKRMSKGMKQKTALIAALMGDRDILVLDEPTTGLDPLMREVFLDLIRAEKARGKTIFMSSHIFEEIEDVCDRAAVIMNGRIVEMIDVRALRHEPTKHFEAVFATEDGKNEFLKKCDFATCESIGSDTIAITVDLTNIKALLSLLEKYRLLKLSESHETLQSKFNEIFAKGDNAYAK